LSHGDAAFDEKAADLVDDGGALADKTRPDAVQRQQIALLGRLDRDEVHGRPLHRLGDGLGIPVVVLVSLEERLDVLRGDQANIVPGVA
jgi:hypothetical protein